MSRETSRCFLNQGRKDGTLDRAARKRLDKDTSEDRKGEKGKEEGQQSKWLADLWVEHLGGWGQKKWEKKHSECTDPTHLPLDLYVFWFGEGWC